MNTNKKFNLNKKSLLTAVTICSLAFTFGVNTAFSQVKSENATNLYSTPIIDIEPDIEKKIQVKYEVRYVTETGELADYTKTKIAFSGDSVTEKATNLKGYELISEDKQTVVLKEENNDPIVFLYSKVDTQKLDELKSSLKEQIDKLPKAKLNDKVEYKENIEKEANELFETIKKIDEETKLIVRYQIKYQDEEGKEISPTLTKLAFTDEEVTEKAIEIKDYIKPEINEKTVKLSIENEPITFIYKEKVDELQTLTIEKIDNLKRVSTEQKNFYKDNVKKASTKKEIDNLFRDIQKIDEETKVMVKYQVKYLDEQNKEVIPSLVKIGFENEVVNEKPQSVFGFTPVDKDKNNKELKLSFSNYDSVTQENTITFRYKRINIKLLEREKSNAIKQIKALKKASQNDKNEYIELVNKAFTQEEVSKLLSDIKKIDAETKVIVKYEIKYLYPDGTEMFPSVTKLDFAGNLVVEEALESSSENYATPKSKRLTLDPVNKNSIVFVYNEWEDNISLEDFLKRKLNPKGVQSPYHDINFSGKPEELQEFVIKSIYNRALSIEFYATEEDVDALYWNLWNKSTNAGLVRLARYWTHRDSVRQEETETKGVYRYSIGITYHASIDDIKAAEDKIDEIIAKYDLTNKSDFDKAKIIHDYLAKYVTPDPDPKKFGLNRYNHTMILLQNTGVCEGYTLAYNRIAERAGLESRFVPGAIRVNWDIKVQRKIWQKMIEQMDTETFDKKLNHAWNQVKINGKWYHLDSYHASYYYHSKDSGDKTQMYYAFLKSENYLWKVIENRIWNNKFTMESKENYPGRFTMNENI